MPIRDPMMHSRVSWFCFVCCLILSCFPGLIWSAEVTLKSIEIYKTHELLNTVEPVVYFQCKGENKTKLPDVKKANEVYNFKGEESWQPLTQLSNAKCKRCGFYEEDSFIKSDDIFDEWEFCPSDFNGSKGIYTLFKDKELNANFLCPECISLAAASKNTTDSDNKGNGMHVVFVILIVVAVSTVVIVGSVAAYKYWQKRKRQQDQARFLKLFEEGDDIEDELGLDV
ncbi:uncharacterized protein LOC132800063 [Ziziphus jujuba]|uniref:Uncharacterized protein LOC132800063 n=1 Tax=Ziziphus jujuba TaxID=326968 RepID=A0ABM3ZWW0_ZIZJJ|nr:uncharacterized protein LOC132800063 [Ziziphus jujuba]